MPQQPTGGTSRHPARGPGSPAGGSPPAGSPAAGPAGADDEVLAAVLIRMWALASGRTLRSDVPPDQLTVAELIDFWADDLTPPAGRHARPGTADRAVRAQVPGVPPGQVRPSGRKRRQPGKRPAGGRADVPADPAAA